MMVVDMKMMTTCNNENVEQLATAMVIIITIVAMSITLVILVLMEY